MFRVQNVNVCSHSHGTLRRISSDENTPPSSLNMITRLSFNERRKAQVASNCSVVVDFLVSTGIVLVLISLLFYLFFSSLRRGDQSTVFCTGTVSPGQSPSVSELLVNIFSLNKLQVRKLILSIDTPNELRSADKDDTTLLP